MTTAQVASLTTAQIAGLTTAQVVAFTTAEIKALTTDQIAGLTSMQVAALKTSQVSTLTTAQVAAIETADIAALSTAGIATLSTNSLVALTTDQVVALSTAQVAAFKSSQVNALTTAQVAALETTDIAALSTAGISGFSTNQIASLSTDQVCALTPAQTAAMSTAQSQVLPLGTPLVLDLNDNGVFSQSIDAGVHFDLFASGQQTATGWIDPGDGFLVLDRNHDGSINDGSELFGDATLLSSGIKARNGYEALADFDTNRDGRISNGDINFADLKIWTDANSNGFNDYGELQSLSDLNIVSLDLNAAPTSTKDNGNTIGLISSYQTNDGRTQALADVWFVADKPTPVSHAPAALTVTPTDMQMGVFGLVDAMAAFGQSHANRKFNLYDEAESATPLERARAATVGSSTASQLAQALSQFDANGRPVLNLPSHQTTAAALTANETGKLADNTAGLLTVGKG
jgi:hypothetical protein